ncbi:MAG TPA: hypothetical protein VFZ34_22240, partial [Blastocatellia bacterium]|nr:hypothetical protein [Blastocatellia bacterium]
MQLLSRTEPLTLQAKNEVGQILSVMDKVTLIKDIVSIVGTLGGVIIAAFGLYTWRRQLRGTSQYELARKAILVAYQVGDAIQAVRNPMLYLRKEEVESGRSLEEEMRIYEERLVNLNSKWAELRGIALETKVIWGKDAENTFDELNHLRGTLRASIWLHFWMKGAYAGPGA